nr:hypothetical protein Hi04_10k_c4921_00003 [uncultured bacterium]
MVGALIGEEAVIGQLPPPLQRLMEFERFHLHSLEEFQISSRDPAFDTRYFPQNCGAFRLPCFWVRRRNLFVLGSGLASAATQGLFDGEGPQGRVLFPIHPAELDRYKEFLAEVEASDAATEGLHIWAVPTSSTRTLLAWPDSTADRALFIKTPLHSRIFGDRRIHKGRIGFSLAMSSLVQNSLHKLPSNLGYLPEVVGFAPRRMEGSGVIVREIPEELKSPQHIVAPLFSLLGGSGGRKPLFLVIIERTGINARDLFEGMFCTHLSRLWLTLALRSGLILEFHGQDILVALGMDYRPLDRYIYRDFEGLQVDWELRRCLGLEDPEYMAGAASWHETYGSSGYGYPYSSLISWKLWISLFQYSHFVLRDVDRLLRKWQEQRLIDGPRLENGEVMEIFATNMATAIEEMFGVRLKGQYKLSSSLRMFVIALLQIRKELMRGPVKAGSRMAPMERIGI